VGLPQLDFRVPEGTWFKSALAGRFGTMPGLSATGALAWPYKIAVVAVMAIVACGTLVTFGSAGAETPTSTDVSALPGSDEASPTVEGQVIPPTTSLLNADDLMSSLNLTDYSPDDPTLFGLPEDEDNDDNDDSDDDEDTKADIKKKLATANPTTSPTTSSPDPKPTTSSPTTPAPTPTKTTSPPEPVEGPNHKRWKNCTSSDLNVNLGICGGEPDFED
jgi:hypothetical protein